jgi:hypothetical protein
MKSKAALAIANEAIDFAIEHDGEYIKGRMLDYQKRIAEALEGKP